jgi:hypothetical protein
MIIIVQSQSDLASTVKLAMSSAHQRPSSGATV